MAAAVLPMVLGGIVGMGASALMAPKQQAPTVQAPKVMPMADDAAATKAKQASIMQQRQRGGRTSTMLSADSDTLGN